MVFNENARNLNDIRFSFGGNNVQENSALADRGYNLNHKVFLNSNEVYSRQTPVSKYFKKTNLRNVVWHYRTNVNGDEADKSRAITSHFGFESKEDLSGVIVEITMPEDSPLVFSQNQPLYRKREETSFVFDDSSYVNPNGVIADSRNGFLDSEIISVEDRKIQIRINAQSKEAILSGLSRIVMNLTPEGTEYLKANNDLPAIPYTMTIKKDNVVKFTRTDNGKPIVRGTVSDFSSNIVTPKQPEIPKAPEETPELPAVQEEPKKEIQAPNTGVKNQNSNLIYAALAVLVLLSVVIFKKKSSLIKF